MKEEPKEATNFFLDTNYVKQELVAYGLGNIIESPFLKRLKGVSFLSTIDNIYNVDKPFSRYDHSLGTAYLALVLSRRLKLSEIQTKILVLTNIIHDVGHAPFSHAAETFLLETKKKYHDGLVSSYLRFNSRLFPEAYGLRDILCEFSGEIVDKVCSLISNEKTNDNILNSIHFCSINCDKIDGTNRTFFSLGIKMFNPYDLVSLFHIDNDKVYVEFDKLSILSEFWKRKEDLYNKYIYVYEVLVAEAMLTRSLELAFDHPEKVNSFLTKNDQEASLYLCNNNTSKEIFQKVLCHNFFSRLSYYNPKLFNEYKELILNARFDKCARRKYETEIAARLCIQKDFVISHFSFTKDFFNNSEKLRQLNLFCNDYGKIYIEELSKVFYKNKLSGDVFEIFVGLDQQAR